MVYRSLRRGPLLICLLLSVRLSLAADVNQGPIVFSATFFIVWLITNNTRFGAAVVTLNGQLLGGRISFPQSVCALGYCTFPLLSAAFLNLILPFFIKIIVTGIAYAWSTLAALNFLKDLNLENKRALALYPIFLFYFFIAWLILISW